MVGKNGWIFVCYAGGKRKKLFLAPLDGIHERAGDLIFSPNNRWVLIEFKKDADSITSEKTKFTNYSNAHAELFKRDAHHYIIFGQENNASPQLLQLCFQNYFSGKNLDLAKLLSSGIQLDEFKNYVEQYIQFKKTPKGGEGRGGIEMDSFFLVAGVNVHNKIVGCLSLSEFQNQLGMGLFEEKDLDDSDGFTM